MDKKKAIKTVWSDCKGVPNFTFCILLKHQERDNKNAKVKQKHGATGPTKTGTTPIPKRQRKDSVTDPKESGIAVKRKFREIKLDWTGQ